MILHQRKFLLNLVISSSRSHVRYPPVEAFLEGKTLSSMLEIPGVLEGKPCLFFVQSSLHASCYFYFSLFPSYLVPYVGQWTQHSTLKGVTERDRHLTMSKLNVQMKNIVDKVKAHEHSWPFLTPVTEAQVRLAPRRCIFYVWDVYLCVVVMLCVPVFVALLDNVSLNCHE